jgi:hypothetical protein
MSMDISELIEIGLAGSDRDRVEIVHLEPVSIAADGVVGLAAIVSQVVYNATELLSEEDDKVLISGVVEPDGYALSIADRGVGMSDEFLEGLNLILANPRGTGDESGTSGVQLVAGLAARHGIGVRLEHGNPGVTARVSIPERLLEDGGYQMPSIQVDVTASQEEPVVDPESIVPEPFRSKASTMDTEAFLESVFGPLRDTGSTSGPEMGVRTPEPAPEPTPKVARLVVPEPAQPVVMGRTSALRTRVPGRNYSESDHDPSHTKAGEAAVEIKLALTDFHRGRLAAAGSDDKDHL